MNKLSGTQVLVGLALIVLIILFCVIFTNIALGGSGPLDFSGWGKDFSRPVPHSVTINPTAPITAAQLQEENCAKEAKVWDDESHSCQWQTDIQTRRGLKMGFQKIPGTGGFRPGQHFWVSPTEVFGDLHEYVVAEDGSVWDSTGQVVSFSQALEYPYPGVSGPDGTPWFTVHIFKGDGQDGPFIWTIFNIVPGHVGWTKR